MVLSGRCHQLHDFILWPEPHKLSQPIMRQLVKVFLHVNHPKWYHGKNGVGNVPERMDNHRHVLP